MKKIESTKCNKCISSGGGDCATCDLPGETAQREPERCDHYDVCYIVHTRKDHVCPSDPNNKTCDYDTRQRNVPEGLEAASTDELIGELSKREGVLIVGNYPKGAKLGYLTTKKPTMLIAVVKGEKP